MALVLIVEDNPINRDVLGRRLERRGFSIRFAEDGPSGIAAAKALMPDVILMDIGLGEMDGCEATRRILANALAAGCVDFDTKPVDLPRLLGKMQAVLGDKTPEAAMNYGQSPLPLLPEGEHRFRTN